MWFIIAIIALLLLAVLIIKTAGWRFAAMRFGQALLIMVLVTFGTTALLRQVPGDACFTMLGTSATVESVAQCREDRRLDESVFVQYADWAGKVTGIKTAEGNFEQPDLGFAYFKQGIPLTEILEKRAPRSGWLFLYSQMIAFAIAVPIGIWSAYQSGRKPRKFIYGLAALPVGLLVAWLLANKWPGAADDGRAGIAEGPVTVGVMLVLIPLFAWMFSRGGPASDTTMNFSAFVVLSVPVFVVGETLRYWFSVKKGYYKLTGYTPWKGDDGWQIFDHLRSLWLPALVLGLAASPVYLRLLRTDMIQNLQQDFVTVAKAKGLPNWKILLRHVLRPSSLTLLTIAGLNISQLVNGAIIVEFIFDLDGMGSYLIEAVAAREYFPVQTVVAITAVLFIFVNTLIDVFYSSVDPRVRAGEDR